MANETIAEAKAALRRQTLARRDALPASTRAKHSARITQSLLALESLKSARTVMAYMSIGSEFSTRAFIDSVMAQGKALLLPRVERSTRRLTLHHVTDLQRDLAPGVWDILEPLPDVAPVANLSVVDWILVPGVAFTPLGDRLGYGAGFYDRLIADITHRPALVAGTFGVQVVDDLPTLTYDCSVDVVVTEDNVYKN